MHWGFPSLLTSLSFWGCCLHWGFPSLLTSLSVGSLAYMIKSSFTLCVFLQFACSLHTVALQCAPGSMFAVCLHFLAVALHVLCLQMRLQFAYSLLVACFLLFASGLLCWLLSLQFACSVLRACSLLSICLQCGCSLAVVPAVCCHLACSVIAIKITELNCRRQLRSLMLACTGVSQACLHWDSQVVACTGVSQAC